MIFASDSVSPLEITTPGRALVDHLHGTKQIAQNP